VNKVALQKDHWDSWRELCRKFLHISSIHRTAVVLPAHARLGDANRKGAIPHFKEEMDDENTVDDGVYGSVGAIGCDTGRSQHKQLERPVVRR